MKLMSLLLILVGGFFCSLETHAEEGFSTANTPVPQILQNVWSSTVKIQSSPLISGGLSPQTIGTGFVISYNPVRKMALVVTNGHVAACPDAKFCQYTLTFFSGTPQEARTNNVRLLHDYPSLDLAFLEVSIGNFVPSVAVLKSNLAAANTIVAAIGYPNLTHRKKSSWKAELPEDYSKSVKRFSLGKALYRRALINYNYSYALRTVVSVNMPSILVHNADTLEGNSGGPLVDTQSGEVIGINTGIINPASKSVHCESEKDLETPRCAYFSVTSDIIIQLAKDFL